MADRNNFTGVMKFYFSRTEKLLHAGKLIIHKTMEL